VIYIRKGHPPVSLVPLKTFLTLPWWNCMLMEIRHLLSVTSNSLSNGTINWTKLIKKMWKLWYKMVNLTSWTVLGCHLMRLWLNLTAYLIASKLVNNFFGKSSSTNQEFHGSLMSMVSHKAMLVSLRMLVLTCWFSQVWVQLRRKRWERRVHIPKSGEPHKRTLVSVRMFLQWLSIKVRTHWTLTAGQKVSGLTQIIWSILQSFLTRLKVTINLMILSRASTLTLATDSTKITRPSNCSSHLVVIWPSSMPRSTSRLWTSSW